MIGAIRRLAALPLLEQGLIVLVAAALIRLILGLTTGLVEDEAYYWLWSQRLAAGYYDHPPMIAWLIAASDLVFGRTVAGVRVAPILLSALTPLILLPWARDPRLLALLLVAMPMYTLGGVLATPDVPLLFGWALAMRGALSGGWGLAGFGAGIAGLSKYTGWGVWPLLIAAELHGAWLQRRRGQPVRIPWSGMAAGVAVTLLILTPNLLWNDLHDWVSVRFQLDHGLRTGTTAVTGIAAAGTARGGDLPGFLGAQFLLVSPLLFLAMLRWFWEGRRSFYRDAGQEQWATGKQSGRPVRWEAPDRLALWLSLPPLVFFCLASLRSPGEANWAAMAWLGACLGLSRAAGSLQRMSYAGAGVGLVLSGLTAIHLYVPLVDVEGDPTARLGVGEVLAQSVRAWEVSPVYTSRYQEAALLCFYGVEAYALPVDRMDQFDLWPVRWAPAALFVRPWRGASTVSVDAFCADRGGPNVVSQFNADGSLYARWQVYEVSGCRPEPRPQ